MMEKGKYLIPTIEILCFKGKDIIAMSGDGDWSDGEMIGGDLKW